MSLLNHNTPVQFDIGQVKSLYNMMQNAQNPQAFIAQMASQNPQFAQILQMCQSNNPRDMFYMLCKQKGINPDTILNQLK